MLDAIEKRDSPLRGHHTGASMIRGWLYTDPVRISDVASATARAGVYSCPTLVTAVAYGELYRGRIPDAGAELDDVSPDWRARWDPKHMPRHPIRALRIAMEQAHDRELAGELAVVKELAIAGAPLLAGTDTPNPYVVPGASLHQELALFVTAGLSPYAALRAATIDAADYLGDARGGRIAPGARADLVLLDADPLADIRAIDHVDGVLVRGRWLPSDELRAIHDDLVAKYRDPSWLQPIDLPGRAVRYVISDNGAPVGAYAMAREHGVVTERQTLEDETIAARATYDRGRLRALSLDVDRPSGALHLEHGEAGAQHVEYRKHGPILVGWLTPATAAALVDALALEEDERIALAIEQPDRDAPETLRTGTISIKRELDSESGERSYHMRLSIAHGTWSARLALDPDGLPRKLEISDGARPVVRTWRRQR
jgi:amidohydrolase family protein